jgi:hypothetical protein
MKRKKRMKNKYLKKYQESRSYVISEGKPSTVCETQERADELFYELGNLLAHEILWEDGEATEAEVEVKETLYINVINELLSNGWKVRGKALNETDFFYCMDRKIEV